MKIKKYLPIFLLIISMLFINKIEAKTLNINNEIDFNNKSSIMVLAKSSTNYSITSSVKKKNEEDKCKLISEEDKKFLHDILKYPQYLIPGIIVTLGTIDLFKAVMASREDEMKKAQKNFIKRLIVGVCIFLVPILINIIIWLADTAGIKLCEF